MSISGLVGSWRNPGIATATGSGREANVRVLPDWLLLSTLGNYFLRSEEELGVEYYSAAFKPIEDFRFFMVGKPSSRPYYSNNRPLSMLVEEVQHNLVAALVLFAHLGVRQVRPGSHPAVDLSWEGLDVVGDL